MPSDQLFYEGRYMGEVQNPFSHSSQFWLCQCCGRTFAARVALVKHEPFTGPFRCTFWKSLCARCLKSNELWPRQHERSIANFHRGGDARDQLPVLRAQFLYESEFLY